MAPRSFLTRHPTHCESVCYDSTANGDRSLCLESLTFSPALNSFMFDILHLPPNNQAQQQNDHNGDGTRS
jgi:hypothetical protein